MPAEDFLGTIKNAQLVITNSFHGVCFSILFKIPFILVEDRGIMTSRFDTLFNKLKIEGRKIHDIKDLKKVSLSMDYSGIERIIKQEQEKVYEFIRGVRPWC
jgi:exopolysaccharide biosynthesis predicted pyruvyltransferase EpsI